MINLHGALSLVFLIVLPQAAWAFSCGGGIALRPTARGACTPMGLRAEKPFVHSRTGVLGLKAEAGMVFGVRDCGKFADAKFGQPVIRRYREKTVDGDFENWRMWYHGRDIDFDPDVMKAPTGRVGLAESPDGISWTAIDGDEYQGAVLDPNKEEWWGFDTTHSGVGDVQGISTDKVRGADENQGSVQFMYCFGGDGEEVDVSGLDMGGKTVPDGTSIMGLRMRIGLALSFDGVHWTRLEGAHHSGALFDVGAEGEWDSLFNAWPTVIQHSKNDFRMFYNSFDASTSRFSIGLCRSEDGIKWTKSGKILEGGEGDAFDARGCSRRCVIADPNSEGGYLMFVEGIDRDGKHSIGLYTSEDGLAWSRTSDSALLSGSDDKDAWDHGSIGSPWVVPLSEDGSCRLYYSSGGESGSSGIGMAKSLGKDWTTFTKFAK
mmetsp:Transcript_89748/g.131382  ORF Transcript_89748/g.131382 Transcript_89748/m.131382 type:complete len:433 (+) Transcript_89748:44-1342(+)